MRFLRPDRVRKGERGLAWVGLAFILLIAIFGISYLVLGTPVESPEDTNLVKLYDAAGNTVNVTYSDFSDNVMEFKPASPVHKVVIELRDLWKDVKGQFTHITLDLSNCEFNNSVDGAKVYLSDGVTEIYVGFIDLNKTKSAKFYVDPSDLNSFDEYSPVILTIKFYDSSGNAINALEEVTQKINFGFVVKAETSSIVAFVSSILVALAVAIRKMGTAIASTLSAFVMAISTQNAVIILLVFFVVMVALWYVTDVKHYRPKRLLRR